MKITLLKSNESKTLILGFCQFVNETCQCIDHLRENDTFKKQWTWISCFFSLWIGPVDILTLNNSCKNVWFKSNLVNTLLLLLIFWMEPIYIVHEIIHVKNDTLKKQWTEYINIRFLLVCERDQSMYLH